MQSTKNTSQQRQIVEIYWLTLKSNTKCDKHLQTTKEYYSMLWNTFKFLIFNINKAKKKNQKTNNNYYEYFN